MLVLAGAGTALALNGSGWAEADVDAGGPTPAASSPATDPDPGTPDPGTPDPEVSSPAASPTPSPSPESEGVCDDPTVVRALSGGDDAAVVAAVGGGSAFREAVVGGDAPCLDLSEAGRMWVVVNKRNPLDPLDHWPAPQAQPSGLRIVSGGGWLRADAAAALDELAAAIAADGVGRLGIDSAFRPYDFQVDLYNGYVSSRGQAAADLRSARPGHSEHQTGLAVDVVACGSGCGTHDGFRNTPHARWLVENSWRFGFVVRYEDGQTEVTGYSWEPWHLRFVGTELAEAYHSGGYRTLEEFFGLPAAPDYDGR